MKPFELRFFLKSPVILTQTLHLDALLAYALFKKTGDLEVAHNQLPLKRTNSVYHASAIRFTQPCRIVKQSYVRKLHFMSDMDPEKFQPNGRGGKYKPIDTKRNEYKADLDTYNSYECRDRNEQGKAVFYGVGNLAEIEALITHYIFGLGKKHGSFGTFTHFELTEIEEDLSFFHEEMGVMRNIPLEHVDNKDCSTQLSAYYPPYYYKDNLKLCAVPDSYLLPMSQEELVEIF